MLSYKYGGERGGGDVFYIFRMGANGLFCHGAQRGGKVKLCVTMSQNDMRVFDHRRSKRATHKEQDYTLLFYPSSKPILTLFR